MREIPENGTLRHQDIDLALSQRAQQKVDKYRGGCQAHVFQAMGEEVDVDSGVYWKDIISFIFWRTSHPLSFLEEKMQQR